MKRKSSHRVLDCPSRRRARCGPTQASTRASWAARRADQVGSSSSSVEAPGAWRAVHRLEGSGLAAPCPPVGSGRAHRQVHHRRRPPVRRRHRRGRRARASPRTTPSSWRSPATRSTSASSCSTQELPLSDVRLLAPVLPRSKVVGIGRNYAAHAAEMGNEVPAEPLMFLKPNTSVVGPGDPIFYPRQSQRRALRGRARRRDRPDLPRRRPRAGRRRRSTATRSPTT